ncbi:MAG: NUDIX domain-containing protein [Candidatus Berkiellales bacterium]
MKEQLIRILYPIFNRIKRTLQRCFHFSTVGVRALVINANQEILLVEHSYQEGWYLPGGGVDHLESPKAAIIRELQEETGVIVKGEPQLLAVYANQIHGASDYPILYLVKDYEIQSKQLCREIKNIGWFAKDNLPSKVSESTKRRIVEFFNHQPFSERW